MSAAARVYLVRHGRASAGWDTHLDPGLDDLGRAQAVAMAERLDGMVVAAHGATLPIVSSPMQRCRETAAPLADQWGVDVHLEPAVVELPSPDGVPMYRRTSWLREAMRGRWSDLDQRYQTFRDGVVAYIAGITEPTVVVSHFVSINAIIGAAVGDDRMVIRSLDNASITVVDVHRGAISLVEGGHEADTLIR